MSVYNQLFLENTPDGRQQISPNALILAGPVLSVEISIPTPLVEVYTKENKQIPSPVSGLALIDTGATNTCVDDDVISQLGVAPIGRREIHNSGGKQEVNIYPAHFRFPAIQNFEIDFTATIGVNIQAQKVSGQSIIALIGRDVLARCVFVYNGTLGTYSLSF